MERVALPSQKKRRKPTNGFKKGNQLAKGNRGPEIRKQKRFIAVTLRNELLKAAKKRKGFENGPGTLNVHHMAENMVRIATQRNDNAAAISATRLMTETIEPRLEKAGLVLDQRTQSITLNMTPAEAEKLYRQTLIEQLPEE